MSNAIETAYTSYGRADGRLDRPEPAELTPEIMEMLVQGDISKLTPAGRIQYYRALCDRLGIDPIFQPFSYLVLSGKLVLYANKSCAEQLRKRNGISITISAREGNDDCYVVTAQAKLPDGRTDESIGAVALGNLKGDSLANALMKAETKSKRRVTLSICGLGMLDETEIETIPDARIVPQEVAEGATAPTEPAEPPKVVRQRRPRKDSAAAVAAGPEPHIVAPEPRVKEPQDEERQRVVRRIFAMADEFAVVGGERGIDLRRRLHNEDERHKLVHSMFAPKTRLRDLDPFELLQFVDKLERRIDESKART